MKKDMPQTANASTAQRPVRNANVFMTINAQAAVEYGSVLESALKSVGRAYAVKVSVPEQSTGGGVRVLQHIRLVPVDGSALVVGSYNTKELTAELRSLQHVRALNRQRFEGELTIDDGEYSAFLEKAKLLLTGLGFTVSVTEPPPAIVMNITREEPARGRSLAGGSLNVGVTLPVWAIAAATILIASVAAWVALH